MQKGKIGVTTENIFPVIKKFLYSDHDIFLRELVSNAVDATQKLRTLAATGEFKGETNDLKVRVSLDEKAGTLTVSDDGIGMTAEEIDKYINQIAFSGVTDFLDKYKDKAEAIIGHFGLGFYDVVLYIDDDCKEFLQKQKIESLLNKYCKFMAVPVVFGKQTEWKDGKSVETDKDNIINNVEPLWTKAPAELKDEDYKQFYRTLFPMNDEPLFWIHLNVDYPFHLTGILYFPRVKNNIELQRNKIQLYCNQVFVTDQVEGIVPEFLTLLHGVIDSPDIPLNVSRSYLQSDANVKKISTYITKKVADRLNGIFKEIRKEYEEKWQDLKLFVNYGMLSQLDFYDRAKDFSLFTDVDGKNFTFEEYKTLIKDNQTDKDGTLVYLYATEKEEQYSYIETARAKGYSVLLANGQLDVPTLSMLEQKFDKSRFVRVDSDVIDHIIAKKDETKGEKLGENDADTLTQAFQSQLPKVEKAEFMVSVEPLGETAQPIVATQNEYMRRMKEMSQYQQGMGFYAQMPDTYTIVLNSDHAIIKQILSESNTSTAEKLQPIRSEIKGLQAREAALRQAQGKKKPEEVTQNEKDELKNTEEELTKQRNEKNTVIADYAKNNNAIHQLIDLALLQNGLLKGAALDKFIKRSVDLIK